MDSQNRYVLVNDDCECCQYVTHAFTLLRLPLAKISPTALLEKPSLTQHAYAVLTCTTIENKHHKELHQLFKSQETSFISFNESIENEENDIHSHFLTMPFSQFDLVNTLNQCTQHKIHDEDNAIEDLSHPVFNRLVGNSSQIRKIKSMIKQVAQSDSTVLILGQSGTGKDVIASCIHKLSDRHSNPLVPINCGAIPSELMESELFGHEKGAFTGALTRRPGRFEIANTGTLFLDEIGDMPMPMQVKLLRVIQERTIERVGGNATIKIDVRLIAATNQKLEDLIEQNKFREDLFYRLNVFPIVVPSLHERADDIPTIIGYHLDRIQERIKHRVEFTPSAMEILCTYSWPGNIRELENFIERMVILHRDQIVSDNDIDDHYKSKASQPAAAQADSMNMGEYLASMEEQIIKAALEKSNGIITSAAKYLHLKKAELIEKMKKYDFDLEVFN